MQVSEEQMNSTFASGSVVVTTEIINIQTNTLVPECNDVVICEENYHVVGADEYECGGYCECNNTVICGEDYQLVGTDQNVCGGVCECNNTVICEEDYQLVDADRNGCGGVCECNNTVICEEDYQLVDADQNGCGGVCECINTVVCGEAYHLVNADQNECGGFCECNNTVICEEDYQLVDADRNGCGGVCECINTVICGEAYQLVNADQNECGGFCECNNTVICEEDYQLVGVDRNGCGGVCECNNTIICEEDYQLVGADQNGCGGVCECNNTVICEEDYQLVGADHNGCGGVCECINTVICGEDYQLVNVDENGCGGYCMQDDNQCEEQQCDPGFILSGADSDGCGGICVENCIMLECMCVGMNCEADVVECYAQCLNQPSQSECNTLASFEVEVSSEGVGSSTTNTIYVDCSWCDIVICASGYELVSTDEYGCGGICVVSEPCTSWNDMDTSSSGTSSRSGTPDDDNLCELYAKDCDSNLYNTFSDLCVFTPPCPLGMEIEVDLLGTEICISEAMCNDTSCSSDEVCIEHYGYFSCMTSLTDTETCGTFDLCGPNFVDEEIDDFLTTFSMDAVDEQYQLSECFLDSGQNWHLSIQVPVFYQNGTTPGLYLEQHDPDGAFSNTDMNFECYIDLLALVESEHDLVITDHQVNSAVFIETLGVYDAPISEDDFGTIEEWDNNKISGWLRSSMSISVPHLYDICGWGGFDATGTESGVLYTELTARYLEGGNDVHVAKTCVFSVVNEVDISYEGRTGLSISFNYWLSQYEPEVEAVGVPSVFYQDGQVGMEVALSLTYNHVPLQMTIGPFDDVSSLFEQYFVFDSETLACYNPHVSAIYADWRATSGFLDEDGTPSYCVDTRCRVVMYIRTDVVDVPDDGVDFSLCTVGSPSSTARLSLTVQSQQCDGRGDDLQDCEFSALQQIRTDLGEYISLTLSGLAKPQVLTYNFAAVTANTRSLSKRQLERTSCLQITAVTEEPWVHLTTGLSDPEVCYDIAGEVCPGDYCVTEEDGYICLYVYVKENELIEATYEGSQTEIIYDTVVLRPLSLSGSDLPSFSYGDVDTDVYPNNTVLDAEMFVKHAQGIAMLPRGMDDFVVETSQTWDTDKVLSGVDGICWDSAELVRFYAELYGSSFEPFKLLQVDFTVRYAYTSSIEDGTRRLLATDDEVISEGTMAVELDIGDTYVEALSTSEVEDNETIIDVDDELAGIDRLELQFVLLFSGFSLLFLGYYVARK